MSEPFLECLRKELEADPADGVDDAEDILALLPLKSDTVSMSPAVTGIAPLAPYDRRCEVVPVPEAPPPSCSSRSSFHFSEDERVCVVRCGCGLGGLVVISMDASVEFAISAESIRGVVFRCCYCGVVS